MTYGKQDEFEVSNGPNLESCNIQDRPVSSSKKPIYIGNS